MQGDWSAEDDHLLAKAVARFPGGTPRRWEMIASSLNRSIADVTKRAKIIQKGFGRTVNAAAQGSTPLFIASA